MATARYVVTMFHVRLSVSVWFLLSSLLTSGVDCQPFCVLPKTGNSTSGIVCFSTQADLQEYLQSSTSGSQSNFSSLSPTPITTSGFSPITSLSNHKLSPDPSPEKAESRAFSRQKITKRNRIQFIEPEPETDDGDFEDENDKPSNKQGDKASVQDKDGPPKKIYLKRVHAKDHSYLVPVSEPVSSSQKPLVTYYQSHSPAELSNSDRNVAEEEPRFVLRKEPNYDQETRYYEAKTGSYKPEASEYYHGYVPYESPGQYYSHPIQRDYPPSYGGHNRHPVEHHVIYEERPMSSYWMSKLKSLLLLKGVSTKALLLAMLPLLMGPLLGYLTTPVVIPITANVAAGRRRRRDVTSGSHERSKQILEMIKNFEHSHKFASN